MEKFSTNSQDLQKIPIRVGDHIIGHVRGSTFFKSLHGAKHFLQRPLSICFSVETLDQAEQAGAVKISVKDLDSGKIYRTTFRFLREHGFNFDRGRGPQIGLVLRSWHIAGEPEQVSLLPEEVQS